MEKTVPDFCVRSDPLAVKYSARQDPQRPTGHCGNTAMGCYDLLQTLGKGNFATVKQAVHVFSGEQVAVKIIDKTKLDATGKTHLLQEVRCMKLLQHLNIVRLYEIIDTPSTLFLVLELADGGDLYDYMVKNEKAMSEKTARHYFDQVVQAVDYCHRLHVVHRDLKPENVLMFRKLRMVKLTDFGFGHFYQPGCSLDTSCGSMRYSSPEILFGKTYDGPAVDVWGLGILLYAMVCGRPPFMEDNDSETISAIMDCRYPLPATLSPVCASLIARMLVKRADERATLPEIRQHFWLLQTQQSPLSNDVDGNSSRNDDAVIRPSPSSLCCPLVSRRGLSSDAHQWVIKQMLDGGAAVCPDDVNQSLLVDEYNNITGTYYLLGERLLRSQKATTAPVNLEEEEFIPVSTHFANCADTVDSKLANRAGCLVNRNRRNSGAKRTALDLSSVVEILEEMEEEVTEEPVSLPAGAARTPSYSPSSSRRLTSAKSSPHLQLNKIKEEVYPDEEDDFLDEAFFLTANLSQRNRERTLTSPERLQRIDRSRRQRSRSGSGSSQTSSDTSDTDEGVPTRLPFSRHRHQRHRSQSSCSRLHHATYSRESSENESPTRVSTSMKRAVVPVLQHSQSLMIIPCSGKSSTPEDSGGDTRVAKKRHLLHRPHSLPPVTHFSSSFYADGETNARADSTSVSRYFISQQC